MSSLSSGASTESSGGDEDEEKKTTGLENDVLGGGGLRRSRSAGDQAGEKKEEDEGKKNAGGEGEYDSSNSTATARSEPGSVGAHHVKGLERTESNADGLMNRTASSGSLSRSSSGEFAAEGSDGERKVRRRRTMFALGGGSSPAAQPESPTADSQADPPTTTTTTKDPRNILTMLPRRHSFQSKSLSARDSGSGTTAAAVAAAAAAAGVGESRPLRNPEPPPYESDATVVSGACARIQVIPGTGNGGGDGVGGSCGGNAAFHRHASLIQCCAGSVGASTVKPPQMAPGMPIRVGTGIQGSTSTRDIASEREKILRLEDSKSPLNSESSYMSNGRLRLQFDVRARPTQQSTTTPREYDKSSFLDWHGFKRNLFPFGVISVSTLHAIGIGHSQRISVERDPDPDRGNDDVVVDLPEQARDEIDCMLQECEDTFPNPFVKCALVFGVDARQVMRGVVEGGDGSSSAAGAEDEGADDDNPLVLVTIEKYSPDVSSAINVNTRVLSLQHALYVFGASLIVSIELWMLHSFHGSINLTTPQDFVKKKSSSGSVSSIVDPQRRSSSSVKHIQARNAWRLRKVWADMCLSIGATDDAERHYMNAIDYMSRNDKNRSDMMWMAAALEGQAAAKGIRIVDARARGVRAGKDGESEIFEVLHLCTEAVNWYKLEGLPMLEAAVRIKLARWWSTIPPTHLELMTHWHKAMTGLHETSQNLVWMVTNKNEVERTGVKIMMLVDIATAYIELGCHRKAAIIMMQAASLVPSPWSDDDESGKKASMLSGFGSVAAYMRKHHYNTILDGGTATAMEVANKILALAAPVFGVVTEALANSSGAPSSSALYTLDGVSRMWPVLKVIVGLRIIATAITSISAERNNTNHILVAWYAATSLVTDEVVLRETSAETIQWVVSILLYVSSLAVPGTIVDGDSSLRSRDSDTGGGGGGGSSLSSALFLSIDAEPAPREIFTRGSSSSPNPFIVGIAKKASDTKASLVYWIRGEVAAVTVDVCQPFDNVAIHIRWMQLLIAVDGSDDPSDSVDATVVDCHVTSFASRSWVPGERRSVTLTCVPQMCGANYSILGVCYGVGNVTLIHRLSSRSDTDPDQTIAVVEDVGLDLLVNDTVIGARTSTERDGSFPSSIVLSPIEGVGIVATSDCNTLTVRNTGFQAIEKVKVDAKIEGGESANPTPDMRQYATQVGEKLKAVLSSPGALPLRPGGVFDPAASLALDLSTIPYSGRSTPIRSTNDDFAIALRLDFCARKSDLSSSISREVWFRQHYRIPVNVLGSVRLAFERVFLLRNVTHVATNRVTEMGVPLGKDVFVCSFKVENSLPHAVVVKLMPMPMKDKPEAANSTDTCRDNATTTTSILPEHGSASLRLPIGVSVTDGASDVDVLMSTLMRELDRHYLEVETVAGLSDFGGGGESTASGIRVPLTSVACGRNRVQSHDDTRDDMDTEAFVYHELCRAMHFKSSSISPAAVSLPRPGSGVSVGFECQRNWRSAGGVHDDALPLKGISFPTSISFDVYFWNMFANGSGSIEFALDAARLDGPSVPSSNQQRARSQQVAEEGVMLAGTTRGTFELGAIDGTAGHTCRRRSYRVVALFIKPGSYIFSVRLRHGRHAASGAAALSEEEGDAEASAGAGAEEWRSSHAALNIVVDDV